MLLLLLLVAFVTAAVATDSSISSNTAATRVLSSDHRRRMAAVMQSVPRVPLLALQRMLNDEFEPTLPFFSLLDLTGGLNCFYNDPDNTPDDPDMEIDGDEVMQCYLTVDGQDYALVEECESFDENENQIECNVCIDAVDDQDVLMEFCYTVACDFTKFVTAAGGFGTAGSEQDMIAAMQAMNLESCRCLAATIDDDVCDYCGLCPVDPNLDPDDWDVQSQLFSRLSLQCPHSAVGGACDGNEMDDSDGNRDPDSDVDDWDDDGDDDDGDDDDEDDWDDGEDRDQLDGQSYEEGYSSNDERSTLAKVALSVICIGTVFALGFVFGRKRGARDAAPTTDSNSSNNNNSGNDKEFI